MTDENTDTATEVVEEVKEAPVKKKPVTRKRATKKVTEKAPVENVVIEEVEQVAQNVISAPAKARTQGAPTSNTASNADGVIGSRAADRVYEKPVEAPVKESTDKVALWSDKNIRWSGVGTLVKGYNITNKEAAEKWLGKNGVRNATPEEVASHYGK